MRFHNKGMFEELQLSKINLILKVISDLKIIRIKVFGISMLPTIHEGEIVSIEGIYNLYDININDIILFYDDNYILSLHRLIRIEGEMLFLKGDNCYKEDIISIKQVLGKVSKKNIINNLFNKEYIKKVGIFVLKLRVENSTIVSLDLYKKRYD